MSSSSVKLSNKLPVLGFGSALGAGGGGGSGGGGSSIGFGRGITGFVATGRAALDELGVLRLKKLLMLLALEDGLLE
jgi:hypothetical protein